MAFPLERILALSIPASWQAGLPHTIWEWCWLIIGLGGQAVFGFRFFFQWMHSEKHGESRIPISFWWMSVVGTIMSGVYFLYKGQFVALLGNGPQLIPYIRNLVLIYRKERRDRERGLEVVQVKETGAEPPAPPAVYRTSVTS